MLKRHGVFATGLLCAVIGILWLWLFGGAAQITLWAAEEQRDVQIALASALRNLRAGETGALLALLGLCFAYGFFHAAGPGHGKVVMSGYALGEEVSKPRLILITLAGALGQAITAILLVGLGALVLGWGRAQMTGLADGALQMVSSGAIVLVGLWLVWRGVRRWQKSQHLHHHHHDHSQCGHSHGPDPADVAQAHSLRDAVALVIAVAIRPCTGAIFVLILTAGMGIFWAGVLGALVMGLGTALLTLGVALGAGFLRGGLVERLDGPFGGRVMSSVEIAAGLMVALLAGQFLMRLM